MPCGKVTGTGAIANSGEAGPTGRPCSSLGRVHASSSQVGGGSCSLVGESAGERRLCGRKSGLTGWNLAGTSHYIGVINTITSILGTVSASNPSAYGMRSFCRTQAEPPGRPRVQKIQKDLSDSSSISISPPVPRTNSRKRMSARLVNKKSSNRATNSAFVPVSSDAASQFACSDRLILIAARESLLQRDGSSISGGLTSNW